MLTYRAQKGAPLTVEEMDGNFRELEDRIKVLEAHLEAAEGIGKITAHGDKLTVVGTLGRELGTFSLPKPPPAASPPVLPLYEKETLPAQATLGQLAFLLGSGGPMLIFFDGELWQGLRKGDPL